MDDQADCWSRIAADYEQEFIDPDLPEMSNPVRLALSRIKRPQEKTVADLGCGIGPLLPFLAERFGRVVAVDFAEGMLRRARERCRGLNNIEFLDRPLTDLTPLAAQVDVAVSVNSLVMPDHAQLESALQSVHAALKPQGQFLGIVPAMDSVHYMTMLLLDRARQSGMPEGQARQNAAHHGEHEMYDFAFDEFKLRGIRQHFWQPFEVRWRLRKAGFQRIRIAKVRLAWRQFACAADLSEQPPPWDWYFEARRGNA
jgi:SAM-dependent methyltransferase